MNELIGRHDNITIMNEYRPSPSEERLLETLLNPENVGKSITAKCKLAEISRTTYYELMDKPEFLKLYNKSGIDLIKSEIAPLIQVGVKEAMNGSFPHWKVLLEMGGVYREKQDINLNADDPIKAQIATMTDIQVWDKIQEFVQTNPEILEKFNKSEV